MGFFSKTKSNREIDSDVTLITLEGYGKIMDLQEPWNWEQAAKNLNYKPPSGVSIDRADAIMNEVHEALKDYAKRERLGMWKRARVIATYRTELVAVSPSKKQLIDRWTSALRQKLDEGT